MKSSTIRISMLALAAVLIVGVCAYMAGVPIHQLDWQTAAGGLMMANAPLAISEQIALFESKRIAAQDGATELVKKSVEEGRTLDEHETEQHAQFEAEIKAIDSHITLLRKHEAIMVSKAAVLPRDAGRDAGGVDIRPGALVTVKSNLPAGLRFTRFALSMAQAKGNVMMAHEIAKARYGDTPEVGNVLKAAISMGGTRELLKIDKTAVTPVASTDTAVTQYSDMQNEFVDLLPRS